jgi:hypothetical protein
MRAKFSIALVSAPFWQAGGIFAGAIFQRMRPVIEIKCKKNLKKNSLPDTLSNHSK